MVTRCQKHAKEKGTWQAWPWGTGVKYEEEEKHLWAFLHFFAVLLTIVGHFLQQLFHRPLSVHLSLHVLFSHLGYHKLRDLDKKPKPDIKLHTTDSFIHELDTGRESHAYGPEQVLVAYEQPDDDRHAGRHGDFLLPGDFAPKAFKHEDVWRHDHGDVIQRHFVAFLVVDDSLEELQQRLKGYGSGI